MLIEMLLYIFTFLIMNSHEGIEHLLNTILNPSCYVCHFKNI